MQGPELAAGEYKALPIRERGDGTPAPASAVPGLELRVTGRRLRFHDPETGRDLWTHAEAETRIRELEALLSRAIEDCAFLSIENCALSPDPSGRRC